MVLSVCRRRLGRDADAEDAFQAVFLALATSASSIGRRSSLPGWLYRVAYLISLKAAGRRARHPTSASPPVEVTMPEPPPPEWETEELKAIIDAELANLPDKYRAVIVLCLIEGRTNADAATSLGVPVGTVDSRLNAARKKLQARLTRRGVAVAVGVTLEQMLGAPVDAAGPRLLELVSHTVTSILHEISTPGAGAVPPAVADLAKGAIMTTTNLRLLAVLGIALGVLGGAGAGIYFATAADPAKPVAKTADQPLLPEKPAPAIPVANRAAPDANADPDAKTAAALLKPFGGRVPPDGIKLDEVLDRIEAQTDLVVRVDVAAFRRLGAFGPDGDGVAGADQFLRTIYDSKAILPRRAEKLPIRDVLADSLAQAGSNFRCTYQIRGSQLVIVPEYYPPTRPGVNPLDTPLTDDDTPLLAARHLYEQIYGGVVSVSADRKPLTEILVDLRKQTGANIVLDPRCEAQVGKATLTVNLSDARLYDALRIIADMAELKMVYAGNIYYVTTAANAKTFQPPHPPRPQQGGFMLPPGSATLPQLPTQIP
jgi:RNA polymerase sigma factor (sigma-70 family)